MSNSGYSSNNSSTGIGIRTLKEFFGILERASKMKMDDPKILSIMTSINDFINQNMTFNMIIEIMGENYVNKLIKYNNLPLFGDGKMSYYLGTKLSTVFKPDPRINKEKTLKSPNEIVNFNKIPKSYNNLYRIKPNYLDFINIGDKNLIFKFRAMLQEIYDKRISKSVNVFTYLTYFDEFVKVSYIICCFHDLPGYDTANIIKFMKNPRIFQIIMTEFYPYLKKYIVNHPEIEMVKYLQNNYKLITASSNRTGINTNLSFIATRKNNKRKKNNRHFNNMKIITELLSHIKNSEIKETTI